MEGRVIEILQYAGRAGATKVESTNRDGYCRHNVLVNFHGQIVCFDAHPVSEHHLHYPVDMTGEPMAIRLMLPARTCLVENDAFGELKNALELAAYKYLPRRGHHRLPYKEYASRPSTAEASPATDSACCRGSEPSGFSGPGTPT